jgi:outer membrane protein insertion porin family/translocation and assembly module TamA
VRRALDLTPGARYSSLELLRAQQAVLDLGVFASVVVSPTLDEPPPEDHAVPITVRLEPTRMRALRLGGGVELDAIRTEIHGQIGWEDRNLLGGFRHFSVLAQPGLVFYPTRLPRLEKTSHLLPEGRVRAELRQPGLFEARTSGLVRGQFNVYPLLFSSTSESSTNVYGYREAVGSVGLERTFWKLFVSPLVNLQLDTPFAYVGTLDPALIQLVNTYLELITAFDFRDDKLKPHKGFYLSNDLQVAIGQVFGDARDLRVQPEARAYVPLARKVTLATRATVGFLFPYNYGSTLSGTESMFPENMSAERDTQMVYLRGFFSGGPTSNRGYPLRMVSPFGIVPFACGAAVNPFTCTVPIGGLSLWEASMELRFAISGPLSAALFLDGSDVSRKSVDLRFNRPHLSTGVGVRYDTPVGPIRLDVGYRIPGLQTIGPVSPVDTLNPGDILGLPMAVSVGIGEAF